MPVTHFPRWPVAQEPPVLEPTHPYAASAEAVAPTRAATGTAADDRDLRKLLRRRILAISALALWGFGTLLAADLGLGRGPTDRLFVLHVVGAVMYGGFVAALARRAATIRTLRVVELVGFGFAALTFAVEAHTPRAPVVLDALRQQAGAAALANADALPWFSLVILYGVLVPNTARRAALVVGGMVVTGAVVVVAAWLRWDVSVESLMVAGPMLAGWLGIAAGFAVFNSARIDSYRRAALQAQRVGQYRLVRKLGAGGMGEVWLAEHQLLKRPCAVKLIRAENARDEVFRRRFEREVQAVTRLTHPAAVQVYDYGTTDDGRLFYAMEHLPGLTLDAVVARSGPLPPARAVHLLRQVCGALREAHALGLVHRDVKPGNVMVCRYAERADAAKLLDFGLVQDTKTGADSQLTRAGGLLGTPAYMSPEQARGEGVGPASDLYSLGAVAYFLLTGRPPFEAANDIEVLHAHLTATPRPPATLNPAVPADLNAVVLKLLAKEPKERFAGAAATDDALGGCAVGEWTERDAAEWWEVH